MAESNGPCAICARPCEIISKRFEGKVYYDCPSCLLYGLTESGEREVGRATPGDRAILAGVLRARALRMASPAIEPSGPPPLMSDSGVRELLRTAPRTVPQKLDGLLVNLAARAEHGGQPVPVNPTDDRELGYAVNGSEMSYLLDAAVAAEHIKSPGSQTLITPKGWHRVSELSSRTSPEPSFFVAMWFDETMAAAHEQGFVLSGTDTGFKALRVDMTDHINKIDDEIIVLIKRSRFVVADFTGQRTGVFFEAGYALGLGKPVIWTCRGDERDRLKDHFDTRQYNHILWSDPADLRKQLTERIRATIPDARLTRQV